MSLYNTAHVPTTIRPRLNSTAHCCCSLKLGLTINITFNIKQSKFSIKSLNRGLKINVYPINQNTPTLANISIIFSYLQFWFHWYTEYSSENLSSKLTNSNSSSNYLLNTSYFIFWLEINCKLTSIIIADMFNWKPARS